MKRLEGEERVDTYGAPLYTHGHMHTAHHPFPHLSIRPFHRSSSVLVHPLSSTSFSLLTWTITFYEPITITPKRVNTWAKRAGVPKRVHTWVPCGSGGGGGRQRRALHTVHSMDPVLMRVGTMCDSAMHATLASDFARDRGTCY